MTILLSLLKVIGETGNGAEGRNKEGLNGGVTVDRVDTRLSGVHLRFLPVSSVHCPLLVWPIENAHSE